MRELIMKIFIVAALIISIVSFIYDEICVYAMFGIIGNVIGTTVFPVFYIVMPIIVLVKYGNWIPLLLHVLPFVLGIISTLFEKSDSASID